MGKDARPRRLGRSSKAQRQPRCHNRKESKNRFKLPSWPLTFASLKISQPFARISACRRGHHWLQLTVEGGDTSCKHDFTSHRPGAQPSQTAQAPSLTRNLPTSTQATSPTRRGSRRSSTHRGRSLLGPAKAEFGGWGGPGLVRPCG